MYSPSAHSLWVELRCCPLEAVFAEGTIVALGFLHGLNLGHILEPLASNGSLAMLAKRHSLLHFQVNLGPVREDECSRGWPNLARHAVLSGVADPLRHRALSHCLVDLDVT